MIGQTVAIYRDRQSGEYRVQPCARAGGVPQEFGPQVILPASVSDEILLNIVLENLPKTETQKYEQSLAPKYVGEDYRVMLKRDKLINVEQCGGEYRLIPFKRMRNSFGSMDGLTRTVAAGEFLATGGALVRQMFEDIS